MSNEHKPLTLERWAALDQAASPGPYESILIDEDDDGPDDGSMDTAFVAAPFMLARESGDYLNKPTCDFLAASRQAPTRLLAALRGLADRWWVSSNDINHNSDSKRERIRAYAFREASAQLRALIEQTDLAAPEQARATEKCPTCGIYPADGGGECPGCEAYREHQT